MTQQPPGARLSLVLDALGAPADGPAARRLAEAFGGVPAAVRERSVGEPAYLARRLAFASGGEIVLHDDVVAAVLLHLAPTPTAPRGLDLAEWVAGAADDATLDVLAAALGARPGFAGLGTPYFALAPAGYARPRFADDRGWNEPGRLLGLTFTPEQPGLACRPEDDDCPACSHLLVRRVRESADGPDPVGTTAGTTTGPVDPAGTVDALTAALTAGLLTEDAHRVPLADLLALHASGLMERAESQLTCRACRRVVCLTLYRDSAPTFAHHVLNDARRRPLEPVPPVEQWGDPARVARARDAMRYVDHEPGAWFLVEERGVLHLDARYSYSAVIDDSVLIRLDDAETETYRTGGHAALSRLAARIQHSAPYREESPYHRRNLYTGPDAAKYRAAVTAAIADHTWLAQQHRRNP
ncbi:hypothetical protein ACIQBJ_02495 [Kitasatospora sp. NPDC088391]|uniref:hypothetical protein n=1 Tax=Kitasatospora sp. NPDC088391 TaxID=3364074 RepID=UPI0037F7A439